MQFKWLHGTEASNRPIYFIIIIIISIVIYFIFFYFFMLTDIFHYSDRNNTPYSVGQHSFEKLAIWNAEY